MTKIESHGGNGVMRLRHLPAVSCHLQLSCCVTKQHVKSHTTSGWPSFLSIAQIHRQNMENNRTPEQYQRTKNPLIAYMCVEPLANSNVFTSIVESRRYLNAIRSGEHSRQSRVYKAGIAYVLAEELNLGYTPILRLLMQLE